MDLGTSAKTVGATGRSPLLFYLNAHLPGAATLPSLSSGSLPGIPAAREDKGMVVYVTAQGSTVIKESRHILVKRGAEIRHTLFPSRVEQLILTGRITVTPPALALLIREGVDVVFLTRNGRFLGRISSPEPKNVFLLKKQYLSTEDKGFSLRFARAVVQGKLCNMATVLRRLKRKRNAEGLEKKAREIVKLTDSLGDLDSLDSLRGMEGRATAVYFSGFGSGFLHGPGFHKRVRRPPTDPINSVLSLLYTFLMNRMYAAVRVAGLDPQPGYLHSLEYGRYSLVLDLMEEFRSIVAETLTLSLFNLRILKQEDFMVDRVKTENDPGDDEPDLDGVSKDPVGLINQSENREVIDLPEQQMDHSVVGSERTGEKPSVKLKPEPFSRTVQAFEKKMTTEFFHPSAERRLTYSEALVFQARLFRKLLEGEVMEYHPILLR